MLNKWVGMGRLTANPELRTTPNGASVATFSLAIDRDYSSKDVRETDFINVVAWRGTADFVHKYFTKGKMMAVTGTLQTRSYTANDGSKRYVTEIVADSVYFAGDKTQQAAPKEEDAGFDDMEPAVMSDDDLPF